MTYPRLIINRRKLLENVRNIVDMTRKKGINIVGITKGVCGNPIVAETFIEGGVSYLGDSRIENLIKLRDYRIEKIMIRLPMISELDLVVKYADISLNSELETIRLLGREAERQGRIHKIILMLDMGDLREGIVEEKEIFQIIEAMKELKALKLIGIATNLTCYGGLIPSQEILNRINILGDKIEENYNIRLEIINGGNSSSLDIISKGKVGRINNLRLGESLLLGRETAYGKSIESCYQDVFLVESEIIEVRHKPSLIKGEIGMDAFGQVPKLIDRGIRKKILCAIGRQDVKVESLSPLDKNLEILGASSDHLILDGSNSTIDYKLGDKISFKPSYGAVLSTMTSDYVFKEFLED